MERTTELPWDRADWLEAAAEWTDTQLSKYGIKPLGRLTLERTRPWAAVARIETTEGRLWFKEPAPVMRFEPALTALVAERRPDDAPEIVAWEGSWLLTRDAGPYLRTLLETGAVAAPLWEVLLRRYAELQIAHASDVGDLLALGVPDKRPHALLADFPRLVQEVRGLEAVPVERSRLAALEPALERTVAALESSVPMTLIHEEVHEGNVFVLDGCARFLDWGEGAVAHPFAGVTNTLRDIAYRSRFEADSAELLRLRDIYLEPWRQFAPMPELRVAFAHGYILGMLCRAVTWERFLVASSPEVRAEYDRNAAIWLDLLREALQDGVRLGAS